MTSDKKSDLVDHAVIRQLADLLVETELSEIEIERNGVRLKVVRQIGVSATHSVAPTLPAEPTPAQQAPESAAGAPGSYESHPGLVHSPMVGTVYLAPRPGAASFVQEGDMVAEGQTLLIIEAMKTMNNIPAPKAGRIVRVLVQNEQPVEFGEPLIVIE